MRTTIDLPPDIHRLARELAHQDGSSISEVVTRLIRQGIDRPEPTITGSNRGLPVVRIGRPVTADDVRSLEDE